MKAIHLPRPPIFSRIILSSPPLFSIFSLYSLIRNSTVKKDECNPVYGEVFEWEDVPNLKNLTLWVEIRDDDPLKDDKIGKCKAMIEELGVTPGGDYIGIDRVVDNNIFSKDARIYLKVKWEE